MRRCAGPLLAGLVLLAGCGEAPAPGSAATDSGGGGEPTTPRARAAVAAEYVGEPSSASEQESDLGFDEGAVGAGLRFGSDGEYDGDLLTVVVGTGLPMSQFACDDPDVQELAGCEQLDGGTLLWQVYEPEEDPGSIYVATSKGETTVVIHQAGPTVEGDPRKMDMAISVEDMVDIANDPRVYLTTSQAALDAGEGLNFWRD